MWYFVFILEFVLKTNIIFMSLFFVKISYSLDFKYIQLTVDHPRKLLSIKTRSIFIHLTKLFLGTL